MAVGRIDDAAVADAIRRQPAVSASGYEPVAARQGPNLLAEAGAFVEFQLANDAASGGQAPQLGRERRSPSRAAGGTSPVGVSDDFTRPRRTGPGAGGEIVAD